MEVPSKINWIFVALGPDSITILCITYAFFQLRPSRVGRGTPILDLWRTAYVDWIDERISCIHKTKAIGSSDVSADPKTNCVRSLISLRQPSATYADASHAYLKMVKKSLNGHISLFLEYFIDSSEDERLRVPLSTLVTICVVKQARVAPTSDTGSIKRSYKEPNGSCLLCHVDSRILGGRHPIMKLSCFDSHVCVCRNNASFDEICFAFLHFFELFVQIQLGIHFKIRKLYFLAFLVKSLGTKVLPKS